MHAVDFLLDALARFRGCGLQSLLVSRELASLGGFDRSTLLSMPPSPEAVSLFHEQSLPHRLASPDSSDPALD